MPALRRALAAAHFNRARSAHATDVAALVVLTAGLVISLGVERFVLALLPAAAVYWLGPTAAARLVRPLTRARRRPIVALPVRAVAAYGPRAVGAAWLMAWSLAYAGWWPMLRVLALAAVVYEVPRHLLPLVFGRRAAWDPPSGAIHHVLLQRSQVIGDLVNATPCIQAIKQTSPGCRVSILCRATTRELLEGHEEVEAVLVDPTVRGDRVGSGRRIAGLATLLASLRDRQIDALLSLWDRPSSVYALAALLARIPIRSGSLTSWGGWMLNAGVVPGDDDLAAHEVEHTLRRVEALGFRAQGTPRLSIVIQPRDIERADGMLRDEAAGAGEYLVGLSPATSGANRQLEPATYAEFVNRIRGSHGARTIIFGGPNDSALTRSICRLSPPGTIDFGGRTAVGLLAALIGRCRVHVGADSGPTHVAAALGVPCVVISPAKSQKPLRWGPWMVPHRIVRKRSRCRLHCAARECRENACVAAITVEDICGAFDAVAAGQGIVEPVAGRRYWASLSVPVVVHAPGGGRALRPFDAFGVAPSQVEGRRGSGQASSAPTGHEGQAMAAMRLLRDAGFIEAALACDSSSALADQARSEGFDVRDAHSAALFDVLVEFGGGIVYDLAAQATPQLRRAMWLATRFGSGARRMVATRGAPQTPEDLTDQLLTVASSRSRPVVRA